MKVPDTFWQGWVTHACIVLLTMKANHSLFIEDCFFFSTCQIHHLYIKKNERKIVSHGILYSALRKSMSLKINTSTNPLTSCKVSIYHYNIQSSIYRCLNANLSHELICFLFVILFHCSICLGWILSFSIHRILT
jgi:hypothetical protein